MADGVINNPVLPQTLGQGAELDGKGGSGGGAVIAKMVVNLWQTVMVLAGVLVIFYFIYGGISWLTAGGDKGKVEAARDRITNAIIGMTILFATFAVVNYIGPAVGFDLLKVRLPGPGGSTSESMVMCGDNGGASSGKCSSPNQTCVQQVDMTNGNTRYVCATP